MAAPEHNRTETEWVFLPDEYEELDPEEYGEVRLLEQGPRSPEESISLGKAMVAAGIDTVLVDREIWTAREWGAKPHSGHINDHPYGERVCSVWVGGGMLTTLMGLSRVGDCWFEWADTDDDFEPFHVGTLEEALEASVLFRMTPTGDITLTHGVHDELVDYLSLKGLVIRDVEEFGKLRDVPVELVRALGRDLPSDVPDEVFVLHQRVSGLLAAGITDVEARTLASTGCLPDPHRVLHFIRALGPAADELVGRRDDIHDLIGWVEGRAESAGISVRDALDQAPPSTTYPGFGSKAEGAAIAAENHTIIRAGGYETASGKHVDVSAQVASAVEGSRTFTPDELAALPGPSSTQQRGLVTVANETTLIGAMRIDDGNVGCLNFAAPRSVGGGYLKGSRAQEEALCRESALYPCLASQEESYHEANRAAEDVVGLWTDTMIHSPNVPVFRSSAWDLLEEPFTVSFVTAPAPQLSRVADDRRDQVPITFERRIDLVLRLFQAMGHRRIVLGAWGCGAFGNDSVMVAERFRRALEDDGWRWAFDHIHFAVLDFADDPEERTTFNAFDRVLSDLEPANDAQRDAGSDPSDDPPAAERSGSWNRSDPKLGTCPKCGERAFRTALGGNPMGKAFVSSRCLNCGWVESRQVSGSGAQTYAARIREEQDQWYEKHGKRRPSS